MFEEGAVLPVLYDSGDQEKVAIDLETLKDREVAELKRADPSGYAERRGRVERGLAKGRVKTTDVERLRARFELD